MHTHAVVVEQPGQLTLRRLELSAPGPADVVVDMYCSGISTGTERLLWSGRMPHFPGMGYPLVPGYESVGEVVEAGADSGRTVGERVFVPGAACYGEVRGLFGGSASRVVIPGSRAVPIDAALPAEEGALLALAATAWHALHPPAPDAAASLPDLVVGHGVLGRLIARMTVAAGGAPPVVWEIDGRRRAGADGYSVIHPDEDGRRDYARICDVSGAPALLDTLIPRLAHGGEIVLAGFYSEPLSFAFPAAFMREARLRVAAEWRADDLLAVRECLAAGRLRLGNLVTHRLPASQAPRAYETAFGDPDCLKMVLDWRDTA